MKTWLRRALLRLPREHREAPDNPLYLYRDGEAPRTIMVTMLGVGPELIDEIVERTTTQFGPGFRLVYVTDTEDFHVFLRRNATFEYVPGAMRRRLHADKLNWKPYLGERWILLQAKWQPVRVLAYGDLAEAVIEAAAEGGRRAS